jgi:hypothetical protein
MKRRKVFASAARSTVNHAEINKSLMSSLAAFFLLIAVNPFTTKKKCSPALPKIRQKFAISQCSRQELIFRFKNDMFPPLPSENDIFPPLVTRGFFGSHLGLFALILPYFTFILPFYFPFSHFLSPFFLFLLNFPLSLPLFIFFPPNDIG